jgi:hypothetical protein
MSPNNSLLVIEKLLLTTATLELLVGTSEVVLFWLDIVL